MMTGLNPEALVGTRVPGLAVGDADIGGEVCAGVEGTTTGSEIVWTAPGMICPALFSWSTWRRTTLETPAGTIPVTDAETDTSSLFG